MKRFKIIFTGLLLCLMLIGCAANYQDGVDNLEAGDYEAAIENFTKEIDSDRNVADSWRGLGLAYYEQGSYQEAVDAFSRALEEGAQETATICGLMGDCRYSLGDYESAISYYEKGLRLGDGSDSLNQNMAFNVIAAYEQMGDYDSAREKLADYVTQYPDDETAAKEATFLETQ